MPVNYHYPDMVPVLRPSLIKWTYKQGQYLAFIYNYTKIHGKSPAEAELTRYFAATPPTIHQRILKLEEKGFISRIPGQARSIKLLIPKKKSNHWNDLVPRLFVGIEMQRAQV
jgi:repressor LexA